MPLLLTVSCFSKIQIGFTFLVPAHPGSHGQRAVKRVCVCVFIIQSTMSVKHTHTRLMALCPVLPGTAGTRKVKPIWILLKQETVSGIGISWAICKSAPRLQTDNHASTTPLSFFTVQMPFLPPNQQHQSTIGKYSMINNAVRIVSDVYT